MSYNNKVVWTIVLLFVAFVSCNQRTDKKQPITDKEFEGIITYKILYQNFEDSALYGDTLKIYYSKGNLIKQYNGNDPKGLRREIFLTNGSKFFMNIRPSDTLSPTEKLLGKCLLWKQVF